MQITQEETSKEEAIVASDPVDNFPEKSDKTIEEVEPEPASKNLQTHQDTNDKDKDIIDSTAILQLL